MRSTRLTRFIARYVPGSSFDNLCFGDPVEERVERKDRQVYHFRPGQIFGVVWWRRNADGDQHRALAVVQALPHDRIGHDLPGIHAGVAVHAMVDQHGPAGQDGAVDLILDLIQEMKSRGQNPAALPPTYWTETAHHILLCPTLSYSLAGERMAC